MKIADSKNPTYLRAGKSWANLIDVTRWEVHYGSFYDIPKFYNTRLTRELKPRYEF